MKEKTPLTQDYDMGVTMYWATVVYFQTEYVESSLIDKHVRNNPILQRFI